MFVKLIDFTREGTIFVFGDLLTPKTNSYIFSRTSSKKNQKIQRKAEKDSEKQQRKNDRKGKTILDFFKRGEVSEKKKVRKEIKDLKKESKKLDKETKRQNRIDRKKNK